MSDENFVPGQRWVSATEPELGLGVVKRLEGRHVFVDFPAVDEPRTYAVDNAPLGRVRYGVGDTVRTVDGERFEVARLEERAGLLFYGGDGADGEPMLIPELYLDASVRFSSPLDRLFAGQIDRSSLFDLRASTLEHQHAHRGSPAFGLLGARVQLLPHQLYIGDEVARRHAPRVLLADEVGLGKTVEAGLVIHRQILAGQVRRVLVLLPETLLHQWLVEMRRRFRLEFTLLDEARCEALEASGEENPFESAQLVLSPLLMLAGDELRAVQAEAAGFDVLVVDEAHHLTREDDVASAAYQVVEALAERVPSVLLLTATPEQLGEESHFARLRLLDPNRFADRDAFTAEQADYGVHRELADAVQALAGADPERRPDASAWTDAQARLGELGIELPALDAVEDGEAPVAAEQALDALLDRHGTGRVLFRNTRASMGGFPARELHRHPLTAEAASSGDVAPRDALQPEVLLGPDWIARDPRVPWLVDFLAERPSAKVLVICARDETALELEDHLRVRVGVRCAVFHRGADLVARDRAAAWFADPVDGAQALICSEVGSEGRNFQFARDLVLFDLPASAELLEQRIGRLDRIGQPFSVRIHVPCATGSVTERLLDWYHDGLGAFEQPTAFGDSLAAELGEDLHDYLAGSDQAADPSGFIEATAARAESLRDALEAGRDRLLELNSCRPARADALVAAVRDAERPGELADYLERLLDHFGVEQERHDALAVILKPGERMLEHALPGLPEEGLSGTYDRATALAREDLEFITWEHPLVEGAMDELLASGAGNTSVCTLGLKALPAGSLLLEARFVLHCAAPRALGVQRFAPSASLRILCDENGRDLGNALRNAALSGAVRSVRGRTAHELVKQARDRIVSLGRKAEALAAPARDPLVNEAMEKMGRQLDAEIDRLLALAEVNRQVRREEVQALVRERAMLEVVLEEAELVLDAVRVVVITAPV